jgi:hypothetical protein
MRYDKRIAGGCEKAYRGADRLVDQFRDKAPAREQPGINTWRDIQ